MSSIVSKKTTSITTQSGEHIEVRNSVSFEEMQPILLKMKDGDDVAASAAMAIPLLSIAIIGWDLKDEDGVKVPFKKEAIKQLDVQTVTNILPQIMAMYFPEKKTSEESEGA